MKASHIVLGILGVFLALFIMFALAIAGSYNGMNTGKNLALTAWGNVENVYQRRLDLLPNLVATVQGAANFESKVFTDVATARASVGQLKIDASNAPKTAADMKAFQEAQGQLGNAMSRLMAVSENYPQLKATDAFKELQAQIEGTENRIAVERRNYNLAVNTYDTQITAFPHVLWAGMFGFQSMPRFEAEAGANKAPKVSFSPFGK